MMRFAVIGFPIEHSVSPAMQQAALDGCGVDAVYERRRVSPDQLAGFVASLRDDGWTGINVTVPHKEAILPMLDELSPSAEAIGAVNTVVVSARRLIGHNTDAAGFLRSLKEEAGFDPAGRQVVVLGAGGAGRAVLWALAGAGAARLILFNRHPERARRLAAGALSWRTGAEVVAEPWEADLLASRLAESALLVNATSVGLAADETPLPGQIIPGGVLVADLVYNPRPTRLLQEAAERGAWTLDGLPMLVYQGAEAFRLWTGRDAPVGAMMAAASSALNL